MGLFRKNLSPRQLVVITATVLIFVVTPLTVFTVSKFMDLKHGSQFAKRQNRQIERNNQVQLGLDIINKAMSGITFYNQNQALYAFEANTEDIDYPSISFVSRVPADFPGSKKFAGQRMRRITFTVEESEYGERELAMYQRPLLQLPEIIQAPERRVIVPNLDTFIMLFYSTSVEEWIYEWDETNSVPSRIKFELASKRPDGRRPLLEDLRALNIPLPVWGITQSMQNPKLPAVPKAPSGRRATSSRRPSSSARRKPTTEEIEAYRKRQEAARSAPTATSRYTEAQRAEYRKRMAELYSGTTGLVTPSLPPGMVAGELGMLLYKGNSSRSYLVNSGSTGLVSGELGLLHYEDNNSRSSRGSTSSSRGGTTTSRGSTSSRSSSVNGGPTGSVSGELGLLLYRGP